MKRPQIVLNKQDVGRTEWAGQILSAPLKIGSIIIRACEEDGASNYEERPKLLTSL